MTGPCSHTPSGLEGSTLRLYGERCEGCSVVFWWDGPPSLPEDDPCRKRRFSGALVPLSDAALLGLGRPPRLPEPEGAARRGDRP